MFRSCSHTLLDALAWIPARAQLPYGAAVLLHAAEAVLWLEIQLLLSVISRLPTSTLLLPTRFSTLLVRSAPHSLGAVPLPRMRVLAVALGPLGILPSAHALRSPEAQVPAMPGAP